MRIFKVFAKLNRPNFTNFKTNPRVKEINIISILAIFFIKAWRKNPPCQISNNSPLIVSFSVSSSLG